MSVQHVDEVVVVLHSEGVIDRWFPSSKLCGACGTVREKLPLNVREWTCDCGAVHDRDVNAARSILTAGWRRLPVETV